MEDEEELEEEIRTPRQKGVRVKGTGAGGAYHYLSVSAKTFDNVTQCTTDCWTL